MGDNLMPQVLSGVDCSVCGATGIPRVLTEAYVEGALSNVTVLASHILAATVEQCPASRAVLEIAAV